MLIIAGALVWITYPLALFFMERKWSRTVERAYKKGYLEARAEFIKRFESLEPEVLARLGEFKEFYKVTSSGGEGYDSCLDTSRVSSGLTRETVELQSFYLTVLVRPRDIRITRIKPGEVDALFELMHCPKVVKKN